MIEIFPISIFSLFIALLTKIFFSRKKLGYRVKMTFHYHHFKSHIPTTYFIIKTKRLTDEKMHFYLKGHPRAVRISQYHYYRRD